MSEIGQGEAGESRLPRGPHGLPRQAVAKSQRRRLLTGAARALVEYGYAQLTVEQILREAGVSRTTFYEYFKNRRDCVLAAHEAAFERLSGAVARACAGKSDWPGRLAAAVGVAIDYATAVPEEAQLLLPDVIGADPVLAGRALASTNSLVALLRGGREHSPAAADLPELTERALIGAAMSVIGARLASGEADRLPELKPQLVELMLLPYVGPEEARRVATSQP